MSSQRHITRERNTQRQRATTTDPVLTAARQVLMEHGPRRATLAEVARQAGVSRMTVYRRFDSFDRVISALLTAELAEVLGELPRTGEGGSVREGVVQHTVNLTAAIAGHPLVRRVLVVEPETMVPLMTQRFGQTQRSATTYLAHELRAGMTRYGGDGSIRDDDPEVLAQTIVTALQSFVFAAQALEAHPLGELVWAELPRFVDGFLQDRS